ncbi:unnamed protein product [Amoebophrya sp. A25]|nr:unnamed protein product [Amoebophrya sp. A25]|eukprot:GSA25T00017887001.1
MMTSSRLVQLATCALLWWVPFLEVHVSFYLSLLAHVVTIPRAVRASSSSTTQKSSTAAANEPPALPLHIFALGEYEQRGPNRIDLKSYMRLNIETWKKHLTVADAKSGRIYVEPKIHLLNDRNMRKFIPDLPEEYFRLPYSAAKSDAMRYAVLYWLGGIYMDTDILLQKPIHPKLVFALLLPPTVPSEREEWRHRFATLNMENNQLFRMEEDERMRNKKMLNKGTTSTTSTQASGSGSKKEDEQVASSGAVLEEVGQWDGKKHTKQKKYGIRRPIDPDSLPSYKDVLAYYSDFVKRSGSGRTSQIRNSSTSQIRDTGSTSLVEEQEQQGGQHQEQEHHTVDHDLRPIELFSYEADGQDCKKADYSSNFVAASRGSMYMKRVWERQKAQMTQHCGSQQEMKLESKVCCLDDPSTQCHVPWSALGERTSHLVGFGNVQMNFVKSPRPQEGASSSSSKTNEEVLKKRQHVDPIAHLELNKTKGSGSGGGAKQNYQHQEGLHQSSSTDPTLHDKEALEVYPPEKMTQFFARVPEDGHLSSGKTVVFPPFMSPKDLEVQKQAQFSLLDADEEDTYSNSRLLLQREEKAVVPSAAKSTPWNNENNRNSEDLVNGAPEDSTSIVVCYPNEENFVPIPYESFYLPLAQLNETTRLSHPNPLTRTGYHLFNSIVNHGKRPCEQLLNATLLTGLLYHQSLSLTGPKKYSKDELWSICRGDFAKRVMRTDPATGGKILLEILG